MLQKHFCKIIRRCTTVQQISNLSRTEKENYLKKLEDNSYLEYKKYPAVPHQDPSSPQYIHSELDEYHDKIQVEAYNNVIDQFKYDLNIQRKVWDAIDNMDRPYKRGIPGIDTNIDPSRQYIQKLPDLGFPRQQQQQEQVETFSNQDRFIGNTPFHVNYGFKHYEDWQRQRVNRPVTHHFNHAKGYKYDVQTPEEEKFDYLADRLGHPEFLGTPIERLFRLENDIYHPAYLDQPFVKMPSNKPSESLNFEQGQVIYQNTRVLEWIKFWQLTGFTSGAFFALLVPFNLVFKTNLITDTADQLLFAPYHLVTPTNIDIIRLGIPIATGAVIYTVYSLLNFTNLLTSQYIIKMSYSKDKELVFVKRVDLHGHVFQQVYEASHLQILPPAQKTGVAHLSSQDENGLWRVTCMNTQKTFLLYNDPKHWNEALKSTFINDRLGLWDKSYYGYNRPETAEQNKRWREEIDLNLNQQSLPKH